MSQIELNGAVTGGRELPCYRSHKHVWALKIKNVRHIESPRGLTAEITPEESGYAPIMVDHSYVVKHDPQPGGYYVVYKDGYKSWSPAEAFEEGYTRI